MPAEDLFAWHTRPGAFERLTPPWEQATLLDAEFPWKDGTRWTFRSRVLGPVKWNWLVEHFNIQPGRQFCYRELKGSFARWEHCLKFIPDGDRSTLENTIDYALPGGAVGNVLGRGYVTRRIARMFDYRHRTIADDLARHAQFKDHKRLKVAITGSRGLIGSHLAHFLTSGGHRVLRLVSGTVDPQKYDDGSEWRPWQPQEPLPEGALDGVDAVIHLAGDGIAEGRWTEKKKQRLRTSRIESTKHLAAAIDRDRVPVFLCGSAVGIYGDRGDEILTEDSPPGRGFLADLCREWEAASACKARVVNLRTSHVLWPPKGLLGKLLPSFRLGAGAMLGNGTQYMPWIGLHDIVYAIHHCLMEPVNGPVNLCTPNPATNRDFSRTLAKALGRPFLLTAPAPILRLVFGEMADGALLTGQRTLPAKLQASGFRFTSDGLESTLRKLLGSN